MSRRLINLVPGVDGEELIYLKSITSDLNEEQLDTFASIYNGKRKKSETILIATILGFFGIAGIQRFLLDHILLGIIYLVTAGLCFIGTIIDLVNYKKLTYEHNQLAANEALNITMSLEDYKAGN